MDSFLNEKKKNGSFFNLSVFNQPEEPVTIEGI